VSVAKPVVRAQSYETLWNHRCVSGFSISKSRSCALEFKLLPSMEFCTLRDSFEFGIEHSYTRLCIFFIDIQKSLHIDVCKVES